MPTAKNLVATNEIDRFYHFMMEPFGKRAIFMSLVEFFTTMGRYDHLERN